MPYIATKKRIVNGREYQRGEAVPVDSLSVSKLESLVRVGLLQWRDTAGSPGSRPAAESTNLPQGVTALGGGWYDVNGSRIRGLENALAEAEGDVADEPGEE